MSSEYLGKMHIVKGTCGHVVASCWVVDNEKDAARFHRSHTARGRKVETIDRYRGDEYLEWCSISCTGTAPIDEGIQRERLIDSMCLTWRHDYGLNKPEGCPLSSGMTEAERAALRDAMGKLVDHHFVAALSALAPEPDHIKGKTCSRCDGFEKELTVYQGAIPCRACQPAPPPDQTDLKADNERLRSALADCIQSLHDEMLNKYQGQAPDAMHPVTRRDYDRDMAELAQYRAALALGVAV